MKQPHTPQRPQRRADRRAQERAARHERKNRRQSAPSRRWWIWACAAATVIAMVSAGVVFTQSQPPTAQAASSVDGITCGNEDVSYHVHAHLALYDHGTPVTLPAQVGIPVSQQIASRSEDGPHSCLYWLHTHDASGVVHIESPHRATFTLGQFLDVWTRTASIDQQGGLGVSLDDRFATALARASAGQIYITVNGQHYHGAYRSIPLNPHDQIAVELGRPQVVPPRFTFPAGD